MKRHPQPSTREVVERAIDFSKGEYRNVTWNQLQAHIRAYDDGVEAARQAFGSSPKDSH